MDCSNKRKKRKKGEGSFAEEQKKRRVKGLDYITNSNIPKPAKIYANCFF